ncbi:MAG: hypothetical protein HWE21_08135, partial [Cytophagia bacterium]|nr:hypothetical protein [Cytophagia bacterium]
MDPEAVEPKRKDSISSVPSRFLKSNSSEIPKTRKVVRASAGDVLINEIVTDPQTDWSTNDFDGTDGGGTVSTVDEWVELYIVTAGLDLTGWTIELNDGTDVVGDFTSTGAFDDTFYISSGSGVFTNTEEGDYLILANPDGSGAMNNDITIILKDNEGSIIDQVTLGGGEGEAPSGNASSISDESIQRIPNASDTDTDDIDFVQGAATLGYSNDVVPPTVSSIVRQDPTGETTFEASVTFRVTFAEDVTNINAADFSISGAGAGGTATISGFSEVTPSFVFDVTVSNLNTAGELNLDFDAGQDIADDAGNAFAGTIDSEETYTISVNSDPTFTSTPVASINSNETYSYSVTASDIDGHSVTITGTSIPDWLSASLDSEYEVSTIAGPGDGTPGTANGTGSDARFDDLKDIALDNDGNLIIAEQAIRKMTPQGVVTAVTSTDFVNVWNATGITVANDGTIYFSSTNDQIFKHTTDGLTSAIAGYPNSQGYLNGTGTIQTRFYNPGGMDMGPDGNIYVADTWNHRIRKVTPEGVVTTFAGDGTAASTENIDPLLASIEYPVDLVFDASGNMFITTGSRIVRIDAGTGAVTTFAVNDGSSGLFQGLTIDSQGNLFSTTHFRKVYKIGSDGGLTKIAGTGGVAVVDGPGSTAIFSKIHGLAVDQNGDIYIAGEYSRSIRKVAAPGFKVTGDPSGQVGDHNVTLTASDGFGGSATQSFTITVNDVNDPVFTSGTSVSVDEGTSATIYTAAATDESTLTFSLGSGNDESLFNMDSSTGELTFKSAPDFEDPLDGNTDNNYVVNVVVTDTGDNSVNQDVTITVEDVDEVAPQMTGVSQNSTTSLNVIFDEAVQVIGSNPTDFTVKDDNDNAFSVSAIADGTPGDTQITLTLSDFSTASGDLTVTYTNNNNEVTDLAGNALVTNSTGVSFDEIGPAIAQDIRLGLDANSNQVDITFSEGVFGTNGGSGAVEASDFLVALSNNSTVDSPVITSITNTSDGALTGGETTIRFNFSYNGTAQG